ncbi:MAG: hypothetical protein F6K26_36015 [Moorea sp. SIO2I5]|nr:hypothetical protein [Moorena sp. SIO2I5]
MLRTRYANSLSATRICLPGIDRGDREDGKDGTMRRMGQDNGQQEDYFFFRFANSGKADSIPRKLSARKNGKRSPPCKASPPVTPSQV